MRGERKVPDVIKTGDEVEITIRGTVGPYRSEHAVTHEIKAADGSRHFVFMGGKYTSMTDGQAKYGITVKKVETFEVGQAYMDDDGDVFIRNSDDGWTSKSGLKWNDSYA